MSSKRVRIWDAKSMLTKDSLVSVISDSVVALDQAFNSENNSGPTTVSHAEADTLFCTACQVSVPDSSHYKTDWHRMNIKLKLAGAKPVSQDEFSRLGLEDESSDEEDFVEERAASQASSSSSINPSAALDVQASTGSARITFITKENETVALWKAALLSGKSNTVGQYAAAALTFSEPIDASFPARVEKNSSSSSSKQAAKSSDTASVSSTSSTATSSAASAPSASPSKSSESQASKSASASTSGASSSSSSSSAASASARTMVKTSGGVATPQSLAALPKHPFQWTIFLCQGGFFAGAVFRFDEVLKHKRIARYTVRRKQGGSQATKDASKGGIHSGGASIRRYNETRLREEIAEILSLWNVELAQSSRIFVHAPSFNNASFFFEGSPLSKRDPRIRHIPIVTQRPSFVELQRIHTILTTAEVDQFSNLESFLLQQQNFAQQHGSQARHHPHNNASSSAGGSDAHGASDGEISLVSSSSSILSLTDGEHANWASGADSLASSNHSALSSSSRLGTSGHGDTKGASEPEVDLLGLAIDSNDIESVKRLLQQEDYLFPIPAKAEELTWPLMRAVQLSNEPMVRCLLDCGEDIDARSPKYGLKTILHVACEKAWTQMVETLLDEGANPGVFDLYNHTPYDACKDKPTRTLLRKFAGANPDLWDYNACRIPPLTEEGEAASKAKEAEKAKKKRERQKERKKEQKVEAEQNRQEEAARLKANEEEKLAKEAALERTKKILTMSDREKRALAAERRLNPKALLCDNCGKSIQAEPFEKFSFKYCSTDCVVEHKRVLDTLQASSSK